MEEKWQTVKFDFEYTNVTRIEISNFGRVRTFNKISEGNILNGSMINGYRIIRLKFFTKRDSTTENKLKNLQMQVLKLKQNIKLHQQNNESSINDEIKLCKSLQKSLSKKFADDIKRRTINYHALVHRLVADYFLIRPSIEHTIVSHLDYNKLNNNSGNLKWMTPMENYDHQKNSPYVIAEKTERLHRRKEASKATKLTVTKVMLLKKLLKQGKPLRSLVKQFKVTDTQILRIKRGENWTDVEAAK